MFDLNGDGEVDMEEFEQASSDGNGPCKKIGFELNSCTFTYIEIKIYAVLHLIL